MRWVYKLTDSETLRGNVVLAALAVAVLTLIGVVVCGGCAVDTRGLEAMAVSDAPGRRPDTMTIDTVAPPADTTPAAVDVAPPAVADAAPPVDALVRLDVQVPDTAPPLLGLGDHCETDSVCASGHCSGGYRVCAERMCGPCEKGTRDGHCEQLPDDSACVGMRATCAPLNDNGKLCIFTQYVCRAGACTADRQDCCADRRMCSTTYGCR